MSDYELTPDAYERIATEIESAESPVGIDAKKTHVMILHQLETIERRLAALEKRVGGQAEGNLGDASVPL